MPSVLIVDDLTSIHEMLEAVIQPIGFTAAFATDGNKALERYKAERANALATGAKRADSSARTAVSISAVRSVRTES